MSGLWAAKIGFPQPSLTWLAAAGGCIGVGGIFPTRGEMATFGVWLYGLMVVGLSTRRVRNHLIYIGTDIHLYKYKYATECETRGTCNTVHTMQVINIQEPRI